MYSFVDFLICVFTLKKKFQKTDQPAPSVFNLHFHVVFSDHHNGTQICVYMHAGIYVCVHVCVCSASTAYNSKSL